MTGKPNLIERTDPNVDRDLDLERAHSMADEGGSFPAEVEGEESELYQASQRSSRGYRWLYPAAAVAGAFITGVAVARIYWSRSEPALNPE